MANSGIVDRIIKAGASTGGIIGESLWYKPLHFFDDLYNTQTKGDVPNVRSLLNMRTLEPDWDNARKVGNASFHSLRGALGHYAIPDADNGDLSDLAQYVKSFGGKIAPASEQSKYNITFSDSAIPKKQEADIQLDLRPIGEDGFYGGAYDPEDKRIEARVEYGNADKARVWQTLPVVHHETMHALQDVYNPNGKTYYSNSKYLQSPSELEARLSAYRGIYGKPIISEQDSEDFYKWFTGPEGRKVIPDTDRESDRMFQEDYRILTDPKNKQHLKNVMRLIVSNQDPNKQEIYA